MAPIRNPNDQGRDELRIERVLSVHRDEATHIADQMAAMEPWARLGYASGDLAALMQRESPERAIFTARRGDTIAAFAGIRENWLRGPYIDLLVVLPAAQGQGVGRALLEAVEGHYRTRARNLWLSVSDFNHPAHAFYLHLGFAELARLADIVTDGADEILMRKRLA
jgi:diamine N-acetyltransferase